MPNDMIRSSFSYRRCVYYHCAIDEEKRSGKNRQAMISNEYSGNLVACKKLTAYLAITADSLFFSTPVTIVSIRSHLTFNCRA